VPNKNGASLRLSEAAVLNPFLEGGEAFPPHRISTPPESLQWFNNFWVFIDDCYGFTGYSFYVRRAERGEY